MANGWYGELVIVSLACSEATELKLILTNHYNNLMSFRKN